MFKRLHEKELTVRDYLAGLFVLILLFLLLHGVVYLRFTSKVINIAAPYSVGDMSRMGYQTGSAHLRKFEMTLPVRHIEGSEYKGGPVDIITIGDSFSNGGGGGKNPFYQDFIASKFNLKVLNISEFSPYKDAFIQIALALESSGMLDVMKPKAILIESGDRALIDRFAKPLEWDVAYSKEQMLTAMSKMTMNNVSTQAPTDIFFVNTGNYKGFINHIKYTYKSCPTNGVCRMKLTQPLFSVEDSNVLEFYLKDITYIPTITPDAIVQINDNFNRLAEHLSKRGIRLYVMPIVDKYDLYSPYIADPTTPKNRMYDLLRAQQRHYSLIDTKQILTPLVAAGEKDIFYADDTHWSDKASEAIVRGVPFNELRDDNPRISLSQP